MCIAYCKTMVAASNITCRSRSFTLLSVSCPSANKFLAIYLLHLAQSNSNSPQSFEGFRRTLRQNFIQIQQWVNNFPINPNCKNRPLSATSQRCQKWVIFTMGSMGKFFICCPIQLKLVK